MNSTHLSKLVKLQSTFLAMMSQVRAELWYDTSVAQTARHRQLPMSCNNFYSSLPSRGGNSNRTLVIMTQWCQGAPLPVSKSATDSFMLCHLWHPCLRLATHELVQEKRANVLIACQYCHIPFCEETGAPCCVTLKRYVNLKLSLSSCMITKALSSIG